MANFKYLLDPAKQEIIKKGTRVTIMEKTEILERIKEAELKVEQDIAAAQEEAKQIIANAKEEARKIIEEAEQEAEKIRAEVLEKAKALIEEEKNKIKDQWTQEISSIEKRGKDNAWNAAEFLYNEFIGMVEHA
ncbi:ATP synthase H subunit [Archaeoglobus veneficus SNP6]|uniref:ATP synthase H subunit n=2 Tax=Archaeoglobus veneficus TaxID=58290 RepID=F2KP22_ARCVS|nr:ATP synthase H subunit [Archaeoglobus veneficus SNP6]